MIFLLNLEKRKDLIHSNSIVKHSTLTLQGRAMVVMIGLMPIIEGIPGVVIGLDWGIIQI